MSRAISWSDSARALFDLTGPTAVSAGAGSGKTTCLVELCLRLMSGEATGTPCEPHEIVAITFTEKAAAELDDRLREAVAGRAAGAPADSDEARCWRARAHALEAMAIGTIHGFARRILCEHALAAGLDPQFEVIEEETATVWRAEASLSAVLAALDAGDAEVRGLVGVHGAGGARGLSTTVAELARERATLGHVRPLRLSPDATDAALRARSALLASLEALAAAAGDVTTATGRCAVEQVRSVIGRLDPAEREGPLRPTSLAWAGEVAAALRGWRNGKRDGARAVALREEIASRAAEFSALAADVLARPQGEALCALVKGTEARYRARKEEACSLDFDDLLVATRDLLRRADGPREELRRSVRALLVDEYQDVNQVQQEIFELIADPGAGSGPVLVGVGDVKQSIYRFRGADVAVFRGVLARLEASGTGRALSLTRNHRSTPAILELVNAVSAHSMQPPCPGAPRDYELAFRDEDRLLPARDGPGSTACEILEDRSGGCAAERRAREATAIAARIRALVSGAASVRIEDPGGGAEASRLPRFRDVAVLFRRLTQLSEYERALREAGVPFQVARGGGFYQAPEVRDLGELLATLVDPDDTVAWAAVMRSPFCTIGDGALLTVARLGLDTLVRRDAREVATAVASADPTARAEADRLLRFLTIWRELRARCDREPVADLLRRAIDTLDVDAAHLAGPEGERRVANLRKALALAERHDASGAPAAAFARRLRRLAHLPPREPEAQLDASVQVALLSIHQAKGLEWPVVFVPELGAEPPRETRRALLGARGALALCFHDAGTGAHHLSRAVLAAREESSRAAAAESRRLLYVALTRARDRLVLSGERGRAGDSWRELVDAAVALRPELAARVPIEEAATFTAAAAPTVGAAPAPVHPAARAGHEAPPPGEGPAAALPIAGALPASAVRLAVTRLIDHARCPKRGLLREAGVVERGPGSGSSQDDPDRATARGTLAHAMLAEIDLGAPPLERRAQMGAAALRRGYDPATPGVRRIMADVARFLDTVDGRALVDAGRRGRLRREVPFVLRIDGDGRPACYLDGAIDAIVEREADVLVLDFKYALPAPWAAERYRLQLAAYAAAVARARPGRRVAARLQFLRGACLGVDLTPTDAELRRLVRDLPHLALSARERTFRSATPAELGRTAERCAAERCGFVDRCYR